MKATDHPEFIALLEGAFERLPIDDRIPSYWEDLKKAIRDECFILASWLEDHNYDLLSKHFMEIYESKSFKELNPDLSELAMLFFYGLPTETSMPYIARLASLPQYQKADL